MPRREPRRFHTRKPAFLRNAGFPFVGPRPRPTAATGVRTHTDTQTLRRLCLLDHWLAPSENAPDGGRINAGRQEDPQVFAVAVLAPAFGGV